MDRPDGFVPGAHDVIGCPLWIRVPNAKSITATRHHSIGGLVMVAERPSSMRVDNVGFI